MKFWERKKVIQLNKNRLLASTLVLLAILGTLGLASNVHAQSIPPAAVTGSYWYSENSTQLASPGSNYVPLIVPLEITDNTALSGYTASVNLTYHNGLPFNYSYVKGLNKAQTDYYSLTGLSNGTVIPVTQLVNISSNATEGIYQIAITINSTTPGSAVNIPVNVAVLGTPKLTLVNYFTNPPEIYQNEKFIQFTAVVSNTGAGPAKNTQFSLSSSAFNITTGAYNVSYLPSGSVTNYTFLMNAHNITGQNNIDFHMGSQIFTIPVYLHNYGSLKITSSLPTLTSGASKLLETFNITNTGSNTLLDVNVHLLSPSVVSIHVSSSNPLGALTANNFTIVQLNPGQKITVTYIVDVSSAAQSVSYPAQLVVQWHLNNTANQFYQTYNFNESVSPTAIQQFKSSLTFTPLNMVVLAVIVILIVALVAVSARSRRIRKKLQSNQPQRETPPSLEHKEIPEKNREERKN